MSFQEFKHATEDHIIYKPYVNPIACLKCMYVLEETEYFITGFKILELRQDVSAHQDFISLNAFTY